MDTSKNEFKFRSIKSNASLFLVCFSGILVIILASNLEIFCIPKYNRPFGISNEELFFIYSVIFTIINIFMLKFSRNLVSSISKTRTILFVIILINQLLLASILFTIYGQIKLVSIQQRAFLHNNLCVSHFVSRFFSNFGDSVSAVVYTRQKLSSNDIRSCHVNSLCQFNNWGHLLVSGISNSTAKQ